MKFKTYDFLDDILVDTRGTNTLLWLVNNKNIIFRGLPGFPTVLFLYLFLHPKYSNQFRNLLKGKIMQSRNGYYILWNTKHNFWECNNTPYVPNKNNIKISFRFKTDLSEQLLKDFYSTFEINVWRNKNTNISQEFWTCEITLKIRNKTVAKIITNESTFEDFTAIKYTNPNLLVQTVQEFLDKYGSKMVRVANLPVKTYHSVYNLLTPSVYTVSAYRAKVEYLYHLRGDGLKIIVNLDSVINIAPMRVINVNTGAVWYVMHVYKQKVTVNSLANLLASMFKLKGVITGDKRNVFLNRLHILSCIHGFCEDKTLDTLSAIKFLQLATKIIPEVLKTM